MEYISLADVVSKLVGTAAIIGVLVLGQGALVVAAMGLTLAVTGLAIQTYYLHRLYPLHLRLDWPQLIRMVRAGLPYLLSGLVLALYVESDTLIISLLVNETEVGWYGTAVRLLGTLAFVPTILMTAIFPAMVRLQEQDRGALVQLMRRSVFWLLTVSIPLGLGTMVIAEPLVQLLYGPSFAGTAPVLVMFGVGLLFTYQNTLAGQYLIAVDRQNTWTAVMVVVTAIKLGLNLVLIPWFDHRFGNGALGAASGLLLAEAAMTIIGLALLPKGMLGRSTVWVWLRLLLAGLGMMAAVMPLRHTFILVPLAAGGVTYLGLLWVLRVMPEQDWRMMKTLGKTFWLRLGRMVPKPVQAGG
jgi:O-antigen/teichoic acid export membrane protein